MPPLRFAPYRETAREIAARLAASRSGVDPLSPWAQEVIVPSRGVAEAIAQELLVLLPSGIAGLQLQTLEELAKRLLAGTVPRVAEDLERRLAMRTAIRSVEHPMMESRGVAAMLERAYRDVRDSGVTLAELTRRAGSARGLRNARRTEAILRAWSEYEKLIAQLNAIDAADRLALASRHAKNAKPQLLAGFYDMTGAQWQFVEALLRANRIAAIWIPTEEPFAQTFVRAVTPYADVVREPVLEIRKAQQQATQYETRIDELRGICGEIAALLASGTPAREIGIVARSLEPYDVRLINRLANEHGFSTTNADELPLAAHRIGRGAITLLRLRERGFLRGEVLELVRDGLHVRTTIDVDAVDAATRRARIAGGTSDELRVLRNRPRPIEDYIALVAELEELTATLEIDGLASLFAIETQQDLEAAEKLDAIAAVFRRSLASNRGIDVNAVIDAIANETLSTRANGTIWCGELLRFRGRSFTHLFVVRMQDDVFPQRRNEDPLLPDSDRALLGLRQIGDGRDEESLLLSLLSDSAAELHYSFATGDGFGKVLRKSRYLRTVPSGVPGSQPGTDGLSRSGGNRQLQLLARAGTSSSFDGYVGTVAHAPAALSPTQLEDFGECPQKFLLKHLLGVTDIDHPEREIQIHHRDKGILDHRVLEKFYRSLDASELRVPLAEPLARRLDALIDEQFDEHEWIAPPFNRTVRDIERRATKRLLRDFVINDIADLNANDLVPLHFEYRFGAKHRERADHPEAFVVEAGGIPVRVEGTIDRIDAGDGRYRVVDYKSGQALRHKDLDKKVDRGVRLQLALYAMAVAEFFHVDAENVSGAIKPLVPGETKPEKFAFRLHEKRDGLLETLALFIRAITDGTFPAFPNEDDDFNSCKYCPVNHSCRTRHDLEERYAVHQFRDPRTLLGGSAG